MLTRLHHLSFPNIDNSPSIQGGGEHQQLESNGRKMVYKSYRKKVGYEIEGVAILYNSNEECQKSYHLNDEPDTTHYGEEDVIHSSDGCLMGKDCTVS